MALTRRLKSVILGFLFIILAVGFATTASYRHGQSQKERQRYETERGELRPPDPVAVVVANRALERKRSYAAGIAPWFAARAPAEVAGRVVRVHVDAGSTVKSGAPLIEIDPRRALIALEEAEARHAEAKRLLAEAGRLRSSNVVSSSQLEAATSEMRVAAARLDDAKDLLDRHTVRAPFDGVVNARHVDVGDAVSPNEPVATVVALDRLRVRIDVPASDLAAFRPGTTLKVIPDLPRATPREAIVEFVSPSADPVTRLFRIEAVLPNGNDPLPGGIQGTVEAVVELFPEGPVLPAAGIRFMGRAARVLVREEKDGKPAPVEREVVVGPEIDGFYPALSGITAGEAIYIR